LIEEAEIEFAEGATMFTGETGSGKTMVLGALAFALGARADSTAVRRGCDKTTVTLAFEPDDELALRLNEDGFAVDPGEEAAVVRELSQSGKSSVRLCGRPATAAYVREIATSVAEIVGQHEAQRLLSPAYHLELLDRFAGNGALQLRATIESAYSRVQALKEQIEGVHAQEQSARTRFEDARFACDDIVVAAPQPGEDTALETRRRYLDNAERIAIALRTAHGALASDEASAGAALGIVSAALAGVTGVSEELRAMAEQAAGLQSEATELAAQISGALDAAEYDPGELERINERLDVLDRLKRRYGGNLEAVSTHYAEAQRIVAEYAHRDERVAELADALAKAQQQLIASSGRLSEIRRKAAHELTRRVKDEFADLALGSGAFEGGFEALDEVGVRGAERVEFLFSANKGEALRSLSRIASGGELSRVLLALVVSLAQARERTALVFDEIDAGIGGATAIAVGARIGRLAQDGQVICVTHLAQLATWAQRHYVLEKEDRPNATAITVREIVSKPEKTNEIARMLSGEPREAALRHARELLARAQ
jgi:DNA repair protein RecN (Recombination protein N)